MRAIVYEKYGPPEVLQLKEVATPTPKDEEVRIRVHAAAVNTGDCEMRRGQVPNLIWILVRVFFGIFRPRKTILGAYFAGEIESVGEKASGFEVGDQVFAASGARFGAYAEYICLPTSCPVAPKPPLPSPSDHSKVAEPASPPNRMVIV